MASPAMLSFLAHDDSNRAPAFLACVTITSGVALVLVALRIYVRLRIVRTFGSDDYTILLATVCNHALQTDDNPFLHLRRAAWVGLL